jgi:hypothetical protein
MLSNVLKSRREKTKRNHWSEQEKLPTIKNRENRLKNDYELCVF